MSINSLVIRMTHLEGAYEQINRRLGAIETRMDGLSLRMDGLSSRVDDLRRELTSRIDKQFFRIFGLPTVSILLPVTLRRSGR